MILGKKSFESLKNNNLNYLSLEILSETIGIDKVIFFLFNPKSGKSASFYRLVKLQKHSLILIRSERKVSSYRQEISVNYFILLLIESDPNISMLLFSLICISKFLIFFRF